MVEIRDGGIIKIGDLSAKDEFEAATFFFMAVTYEMAAKQFPPDAVTSGLINALRNHSITTGIEPEEFKKILRNEIAIFEEHIEKVRLANQTEGEA